MNVAKITMPQEEAREKLEAYRAQLRRRADAEYAACVAGYEALAAGTPLINLQDAIRNGGFDEKMRPRLAVARADRRQVRFHRSYSPTGFFSSGDWYQQGRFPSLHIGIDFGEVWQRRVEGYALVPMIPADVRPAVGQPRNWRILWEVESWSDRPIGAVPDRDPYLLKHVGGDLYAVLAEWDLTDLERAVMAERSRR